MKAEVALRTLIEKRGYVVIGFPAGTKPITIGNYVSNFAGACVAGGVLWIAKATNRDDWEAQAAVIGKTTTATTGKCAPRDGEQFYRCTLGDNPCRE